MQAIKFAGLMWSVRYCCPILTKLGKCRQISLLTNIRFCGNMSTSPWNITGGESEWHFDADRHTSVNFIYECAIDSFHTSQKTHWISSVKTSQSRLFRKRMAAYSKSDVKLTNTLRRLNSEYYNVKVGRIVRCRGLFVSHKTSSGLDDWIYWHLIHS
jgi:hypothetical protein